jgi:N-acetylneuraminic acid mutarotase
MAHSLIHRALLVVTLQHSIGCAPTPTPEVPPAPAQRTQQSAPPATSSVLAPGYASFASEMPTAVTSFGATAHGKHVYVLGGYAGEPHQYNKEGQSDTFARLDTSSGKWETLASLGKVQSATLDTLGSSLIRVGGMRINNSADAAANLRSVADVDLFNLETSTWSKANPLPEPRSSHATVVVDDKIYVLGGWALEGAMDSGTWATSMFIGEWEGGNVNWRAEPVPLRSRALGAAALDHRIIAVGGIDGRRVQRTTHVYDTRTRSWSIGPEYPEPAFGVAVTRRGEHVFASGASGAVYVLDASLSAWQPYSQLTFPRFFHAMVALDDRLLVLGGVPGTHDGARVRHIEQVAATREPTTSWIFPAASGAKNRQGAFLSGNGLFVFGGNKALGQHDFAPANFVQDSYRLDLASLEWTKLNPFPRAAQSMQAIVTAGGLGVASGGFGPNGGALTSSPEVFHYDFKTDAWSKAGVFPESRTQFGFAEYAQDLWVFGGMTFDDSKKDSQFAYPTSVLHRNVDAVEPFVASTVTIPRERRAFAWATLEDRFYMIGGMAAGFGLVSECDVFDFVGKTWATVPCPSRVRIGAEMVALKGKLYLIAGRSKPSPDSELSNDPRVEVYDPKTATWSVLLDQLPVADTHQLRAFAFGDKLLLYTAQREDAQVQIVIVDPLASHGASETKGSAVPSTNGPPH